MEGCLQQAYPGCLALRRTVEHVLHQLCADAAVLHGGIDGDRPDAGDDRALVEEIAADHATVELGEGCELISHVAIEGPTKIGARNRFFPFSSIGLAPQDLSYKNEPTRLEIGDDNTIREFVTINRGTAKGGGLTRIGSHTLIMAYSHVAHDCDLGDNVTLVNGATLGGHVTIGDGAIIERAILDKDSRIGAGVRILNRAGRQHADADNYVIRDGIVIIPTGAVVADGTEI